MEKETLKELKGLFEELCAKGKAYRAKRMAAGEKSSAYLSGRAVKVCKGQMKGENIEELEAEDDTEFTVSLKHLLKKHVNKGGEIEEHTVTFTKDEMAKLHNDGEVTKADNKGKDHTYKFNELKEYYVDAVNENEAYCPVCTEAMLETVKKTLNKIDEKKGKCKPSKGKRFSKRVSGKCRSFGQKGKAKKGGDRIRPGTKKGNAYCARSAKIKKCKNPPCANALSRKKWKCQGSRSVK